MARANSGIIVSPENIIGAMLHSPKSVTSEFAQRLSSEVNDDDKSNVVATILNEM